MSTFTKEARARLSDANKQMLHDFQFEKRLNSFRAGLSSLQKGELKVLFDMIAERVPSIITEEYTENIPFEMNENLPMPHLEVYKKRKLDQRVAGPLPTPIPVDSEKKTRKLVKSTLASIKKARESLEDSDEDTVSEGEDDNKSYDSDDDEKPLNALLAEEKVDFTKNVYYTGANCIYFMKALADWRSEYKISIPPRREWTVSRMMKIVATTKGFEGFPFSKFMSNRAPGKKSDIVMKPQ